MRDFLDNHPLKLGGSASQSSPQRTFVLALVLCLIALALVFLDGVGMLDSARGVLERTVKPVAQKLTGLRLSVVDFWAEADDVSRLKEENEALKHQLSQLQTELIAREQLLVENARLRQQLAIEERQPWRMMGAEMIVRSPDAGRRVLTIARGWKDQVQVGMAVVAQTETEPAALIGVVDAVGPHTASVLLLSDSGSRLSVRILSGETSALGLVEGQWQEGRPLRLEQLDRMTALQPGARVVTAGLSGDADVPLPLASVPSGIPIGVVGEVLSTGGHTQVATVHPHVDLDEVRYVWVIRSHEK